MELAVAVEAVRREQSDAHGEALLAAGVMMKRMTRMGMANSWICGSFAASSSVIYS